MKSNISKIKNLSAQNLKELIDSKQKLYILDVREKDEFSQGFIKGAINIPLSILSKEILLSKFDCSNNLNKELIIYCRSGKRSLQAVNILEEQGINCTLKNLSLGIMEWIMLGYPLSNK